MAGDGRAAGARRAGAAASLPGARGQAAAHRSPSTSRRLTQEQQRKKDAKKRTSSGGGVRAVPTKLAVRGASAFAHAPLAQGAAVFCRPPALPAACRRHARPSA